MSHIFTTGQRALLAAELERRQHALERQIAEHHSGLSRAEHAHEVLEQDGDDAPQRANALELDLAQSDMAQRELAETVAALRRLPGDDFGRCADCGEPIAFDRLKVEPWALRCVACETVRERASGHSA